MATKTTVKKAFESIIVARQYMLRIDSNLNRILATDILEQEDSRAVRMILAETHRMVKLAVSVSKWCNNEESSISGNILNVKGKSNSC